MPADRSSTSTCATGEQSRNASASPSDPARPRSKPKKPPACDRCKVRRLSSALPDRARKLTLHLCRLSACSATRARRAALVASRPRYCKSRQRCSHDELFIDLLPLAQMHHHAGRPQEAARPSQDRRVSRSAIGLPGSRSRPYLLDANRQHHTVDPRLPDHRVDLEARTRSRRQRAAL